MGRLGRMRACQHKEMERNEALLFRSVDGVGVTVLSPMSPQSTTSAKSLSLHMQGKLR
jgi:hypothetical protein